uniref:Uncharacterized protein n=1 Tax=Nelumbo nucifera TaxID=4432 RepID=A0A822YIJ7_NELNU|nr:TPA_asm: hypothetical protein HUJ06_030706 [Nelumbo nucifera]
MNFFPSDVVTSDISIYMFLILILKTWKEFLGTILTNRTNLGSGKRERERKLESFDQVKHAMSDSQSMAEDNG